MVEHIVLTGESGESHWIMSRNIVNRHREAWSHISLEDSKVYSGEGSKVYMTNGSKLLVRETPDQIKDLLFPPLFNSIGVSQS